MSGDYAEIIVSVSHKQVDRPFHYKIPSHLKELIRLGSRVTVPFGAGNKNIDGYVVGFSGETDFDEDKIKSIQSVAEAKPFFSEELLRLARWMRDKYGATLYDCLRCIIPAGINMKADLSQKIKFAYINYDNENIYEAIDELVSKNSAQSRIVNLLRENGGMAVSDLRVYLRISASPVNTLVKNGVIYLEDVEILRDAYVDADGAESENIHRLTGRQEQILDAIENKRDHRPILLHGVTGSGKTEIYLRLIEKILAKGQQAIVLVPEISLTAQTVNIFTRRFGDRVSVTHSRLTLGERFDQWKKARDGLVSVMIGPRSAVFAPFPNIGAIIIDEEHESTYKSETTPKYSAKEVAIERGRLTGALVVLGSATPSVESYFQAESGKFELLEITERVNKTYPDVHIVDMRDELACGNRSFLSMQLHDRIAENLKRGQQSIMFLNRRGFSPFVSCRKCGYVMKCDDCSVNYTYHISTNSLTCHYCGKKLKNPENCPACGSKYIKYFGIGTQKLEEKLKEIFPTAGILRMDMDTTSGKHGHANILGAFRRGEAQILIGTQMIAKGLDFPNVTLVGIIAADMSLNNGDFRAGETTFQLLTQVAGRAGRSNIHGQVVIQTYNPEHYSIVYSRDNNYKAFYEHEITLRRQMNYPPYTSVFSILFTSASEKNIIVMLFKLLEIMRHFNRKGLFEMIGPAPASISKIKKQYRWKLIVKSADEEKLKNFVNYCLDKLREKENFGDITVSLTLNPVLLV